MLFLISIFTYFLWFVKNFIFPFIILFIEFFQNRFTSKSNVKFLNENGNPSITFSILDNRAALKTGTVTLELSQLDYEVKEDEKSIYFINLNEKTKDFSNYRLSYSFDKKNRPKMDLYRISDNKKLCSLIAN